MTRNVPLLEDCAVQATPLRDGRSAAIVHSLGKRSVVLVGLMGCGKTSTGRWLARRLGLEFVDADTEIEWAHRMSISEIFETHGEAYFRAGERRVMARLLSEGPRVIATGGGAFVSEQTRAAIGAKALSVWLKADLDVLWRRVRRRTHRPLLKTADPEGTLRTLMEQRYPVYGRADITVVSRDGPQDVVVQDLRAPGEFNIRLSPDLPDPSPRPCELESRRSHRPSPPPVACPSSFPSAATTSSSAARCFAMPGSCWRSTRRARPAPSSLTTTSPFTTLVRCSTA